MYYINTFKYDHILKERKKIYWDRFLGFSSFQVWEH